MNHPTMEVELTLNALPRRPRRRARPKATETPAAPLVRLPRITRLMALAIKFQEMVDRGEVRDYADLARLGYVTRARVTQIMNLLNLAPDIQEGILAWNCDDGGTPTPEHEARRVTAHVLWADQRLALSVLKGQRAEPHQARRSASGFVQ
jgi:hypothetical protein